MNTQCMQTGLGSRSDLVSATGPSKPSTGPSLKGFFAAAAAGVHHLTAGFAQSRTRRAALRELSGLSDRQLTDIGLHRAQLGEVVERMLSAARRRSDRADA